MTCFGALTLYEAEYLRSYFGPLAGSMQDERGWSLEGFNRLQNYGTPNIAAHIQLMILLRTIIDIVT